MSVIAIACAILALVPQLDPVRAEYHAAIIASVAATESEAAAMVVNGAHESAFLWGFEICEFHGKGGEGIYGLGVGYEAFQCGPPETQARGSVKAMRDKGFPARPLRAFQGYLGAAVPEARVRLALWTITAERIRCACSF